MKIDFYILEENTAKARLHFTCKLLEKAYKNRHRVYIHAQDQQQAHLLDEMLWTYKEDSFIPHNLYGEGPELAPPIQIGFDVVPEKHQDILINLHSDIPNFYRQFARLIEVVSAEPTVQAVSREHYKYYRNLGFTINTHKLQILEA